LPLYETGPANSRGPCHEATSTSITSEISAKSANYLYISIQIQLTCHCHY